MICRQVDETVTRHAGRGRPKSVLLQLVNILNTLFKYWMGSGHSLL